MQGNPQTRLQDATSIKAQNITGVINGSSVDTLGFSEALVAVRAGDMSASGTVTVQVDEADDDGTGSPAAFAAVATALVALANANDNTTTYMRLGLHKRKRWLRLSTSVAASGTGLVCGSITLSGAKDTRYFTNTYALDLRT